jgi:hypothetical protein
LLKVLAEVDIAATGSCGRKLEEVKAKRCHGLSFRSMSRGSRLFKTKRERKKEKNVAERG